VNAKGYYRRYRICPKHCRCAAQCRAELHCAMSRHAVLCWGGVGSFRSHTVLLDPYCCDRCHTYN
jgi:hypothetical protein